jgi:hypothetical protein
MVTKNSDEGYDPEWLEVHSLTSSSCRLTPSQFEAGLGGRQVLTGTVEENRQAFDATGEAFAKLWPKLDEELTISKKCLASGGQR